MFIIAHLSTFMEKKHESVNSFEIAFIRSGFFGTFMSHMKRAFARRSTRRLNFSRHIHSFMEWNYSY